ncbi:SGNH/GDSL hydrolase family protein [Actinophytocola sp.]|uniref:SGNH/GDSL hydrolase family protein n=1 Tax=Actinophytocola sp. TaxID=1872138 RepID=UPI003D6BC078
MRRLLPLLTTAAAIATVAAVALSGSASAAPAVGKYVALGDSFAAVGSLDNIHGDPIGCARATDNYPSGVAARLGAGTFVDATCGGAETVHMTQPQSVTGGDNAPQFDALTPDTSLVTLSISGNDIGFSDIAKTCAEKSFTNPFGSPCEDHFTEGGTDELAERINAVAGPVDAVLDGIHERAPQATVVVVGYLRILPPTDGCWPIVPFAGGDVPYFDGVQHQLNAMLAAQAAANGAVFVNAGDLLGHDVCSDDKYVEGLIPESLSVPLHPNAKGQAYVADLVAAALS